MSEISSLSKAWDTPATQPRSYFNTASLALDLPEDGPSSELDNLGDFDELRHRVEARLALLFWPWFREAANRETENGEEEDDNPVNTAVQERLALFDNTTAGIQRILLLLRNHFAQQDVENPTLLTTDVGYPGVVSAIDDYWRGTTFMVRLSEALDQDELVPEESIGDEENPRVNLLKRAVQRIRPDVILLSHVTRCEGWRVPDSFFGWLQKRNWYWDRPSRGHPWLIVDGAQSVGNTEHWFPSVNDDLHSSIDFYVTSLHKWLGGKPKLGLVVAGDADLQDENFKLSDPAQSYSRTQRGKGQIDVGSGGTGDLVALKSVGRALNDLLDVQGDDAWAKAFKLQIDQSEDDADESDWVDEEDVDDNDLDGNEPKRIRYVISDDNDVNQCEEMWEPTDNDEDGIKAQLEKVAEHNRALRRTFIDSVPDGIKVVGACDTGDWRNDENDGYCETSGTAAIEIETDEETEWIKKLEGKILAFEESSNANKGGNAEDGNNTRDQEIYRLEFVVEDNNDVRRTKIGKVNDITDETYYIPEGGYRFSFHYYHEAGDIKALFNGHGEKEHDLHELVFFADDERDSRREGAQLLVLKLIGVRLDRAENLLEEFGGIQAIMQASADELKDVDGIGHQTVKKIHTAYRE